MNKTTIVLSCIFFTICIANILYIFLYKTPFFRLSKYRQSKLKKNYVNLFVTDKRKVKEQYMVNFSKTKKSLKDKIIPTIIVGVMITEHTSIERIKTFRESVPQNNKNVKLILKFVQGNATKIHIGTDVVVLNIFENLDEGKTFHWFEFAVKYLAVFEQYHKLNGIVKMDIDCAVNWNEFTKNIFVKLKPYYYFGRVNDFVICGGGSHCPPSSCQDFSGDCWIYMSGGWYALSYDLTNHLVFNCKYPSQNIIGFEDLMVGKWIKNCFNDTFVYSVKNGDFFCHDNSITNQDILHFNNKQCLK
jgi:hypothetical protein